MDDFERLHRRRSIRLQGYDYSQDGAYFVTICVQHRESLFGEIVDDMVRLNQAGQMVEKWWQKLSSKFPDVEIDTFVVMPNHFHGIVVLVGADPCVCPGDEGAHVGAPLQRPAVGDVVRWFKTMTTNAYIRGVKENGWTAFPGKLWQRNYYEHVIRNESSLNDIRSYIQTNPAKWTDDQENPAHINRGEAL